MIFELGENTSRRVQIAKTGTFNHAVYGKFSITLDDLKKMKTHFLADVRRQKIDGKPVLPFDYRHNEDDKAAGWITSLEVDTDKNGAAALFAEVDWTDEGAAKIRGKEFKFVSPSIRRNYQDSETGKTFDVILAGAALTNVPFLRDMEAVHLLSESRRAAFESLKLSGDEPDFHFKEGENIMAQQIAESFQKLSPDDQTAFLLACGLMRKDKKLSEELEKTKTDLEKAQNDLKLSLEETQKLTEKMSASGDASDKLKLAEAKIEDQGKKIASLVEKMAETERKAEFDQMLSEGKVCEAQREPFMKQNFSEFAKKAEEIKLTQAGAGARGNESETDASEQLVKLAEKKSTDEKISFADAMKIVLSENPKLAADAGQ